MNIGRHMIAMSDGPRWRVLTKKSVPLGTIEWGEWNQYEFVPEWGTAFTSDCLRAMAGRLDELTSERLRRAASGGGS